MKEYFYFSMENTKYRNEKFTETIHTKILIICFPVRGSKKTITSSSGSDLARSLSLLQPFTSYLTLSVRHINLRIVPTGLNFSDFSFIFDC